MSENIADIPLTWFRRISQWANRVGLAGKLAVLLTIAAVASGIATYVAFTQPAVQGPRATGLVVGLLYLDLGLLVALGLLVVRRIMQVWAERRRGLAGARLHIRLVVLFSLVALIPAITLAIFSGLVFNFGLQNWFSQRVRTALNESQAVAESYLDEHRRNIGGDVLAMAQDVDREGPLLVHDPRSFNGFIEAQTQVRNLSEAVVFDNRGRILGRSRMSFELAFERAPVWAMEQANQGGVVYLASQDDDRIRALVALKNLDGAYLLVGRFVDPRVLDRIEQTKSAVSSYRSLEQVRSDLQILYALIFVVVSLLLVFVSVWIGLNFANKLARPITGLVNAAERVRAGDLTARVEEEPDADELGTLSRAFNRMTSQLESQRRELVEANRQIDARRRFIEAVLSGVSAGVIGLDPDGRINFPNQSASELMASDLDHALGRPITDFVPEMAPMMERARHNPQQVQEAQIDIHRSGRVRTLLVRITAEGPAQDVRGFVVTFDDITMLISAQRKAAWSDVARRLAHEIKNPLTPIQLSAERLRRRYLDEIRSDPGTFSTCVDTIIRQVGDIGNMITEFSNFARMPAPDLKSHDIGMIVRRAVFLQRGGHSDIDYQLSLPEDPIAVTCDDRQVGQAMTNLLQNAADAIGARLKKTPDGPRGRISVAITREGANHVVVSVEDNGVGLPKGLDRDLTDPYVTTRAEGTGLGLAIVRKIMEDHDGELSLEDLPEGGARVSLSFLAGEGMENTGFGDGNSALKKATHES